MYKSKGLVDQFSQIHPFTYMGRSYYLTDAKVLNPATNTTDNHILLTDGSFTPITLLPFKLPEHLAHLSNFSAPSI